MSQVSILFTLPLESLFNMASFLDINAYRTLVSLCTLTYRLFWTSNQCQWKHWYELITGVEEDEIEPQIAAADIIEHRSLDALTWLLDMSKEMIGLNEDILVACAAREWDDGVQFMTLLMKTGCWYKIPKRPVRFHRLLLKTAKFCDGHYLIYLIDACNSCVDMVRPVLPKLLMSCVCYSTQEITETILNITTLDVTDDTGGILTESVKRGFGRMVNRMLAAHDPPVYQALKESSSLRDDGIFAALFNYSLAKGHPLDSYIHKTLKENNRAGCLALLRALPDDKIAALNVYACVKSCFDGPGTVAASTDLVNWFLGLLAHASHEIPWACHLVEMLDIRDREYCARHLFDFLVQYPETGWLDDVDWDALIEQVITATVTRDTNFVNDLCAIARQLAGLLESRNIAVTYSPFDVEDSRTLVILLLKDMGAIVSLKKTAPFADKRSLLDTWLSAADDMGGIES